MSFRGTVPASQMITTQVLYDSVLSNIPTILRFKTIPVLIALMISYMLSLFYSMTMQLIRSVFF